MEGLNMNKTETTQEYIDLLSKYSPYMGSYYRQTIDFAVKLKNGAYYEIEKPSIKTRFCFGAGYCGVSSQSEDEFANDQANEARTNESYFLSENLEELERLIKNFQDPNQKLVGVYEYGSSGILKATKSAYRDIYECEQWRVENPYEFDEEERKEILEALEAEKEAFTKRLKTYLKRYGLSKLNVWTYLRD